MASEVMLAPTPAPATSIREMDDVRDMVRNATVTTIYVSRISANGIQNIIRSLDLYHPPEVFLRLN